MNFVKRLRKSYHKKCDIRVTFTKMENSVRRSLEHNKVCSKIWENSKICQKTAKLRQLLSKDRENTADFKKHGENSTPFVTNPKKQKIIKDREKTHFGLFSRKYANFVEHLRKKGKFRQKTRQISSNHREKTAKFVKRSRKEIMINSKNTQIL